MVGKYCGNMAISEEIACTAVKYDGRSRPLADHVDYEPSNKVKPKCELVSLTCMIDEADLSSKQWVQVGSVADRKTPFQVVSSTYYKRSKNRKWQEMKP